MSDCKEIDNFATYDVAVLIPCFNEEKTIGSVIFDFKKYIPSATIYVYDNNSMDNTIAEALSAGAIVRRETLQGKGNVVRRMFADIDADIYIIVDGDSTYQHEMACELIKILLDGPFDMVNAARITQDHKAYRFGHSFGNKLLTFLVAKIFDSRIKDMLSGYRVFSRRFAKSFPCISEGFEIETKLTIHALSLRMPLVEIDTKYYARPEGSFSKLSTYKDGLRILRMIIALIRKEKPLLFFNTISALFFSISLGLGVPIVLEFFATGLVPRFPTAILAVSLMLSALLSLVCGLILDTVTRGRWEAKFLKYLSYSAPKGYR